MPRDDEMALTTLKILIVGESGVGKSSLMLRFVDDTFDEEMAATIGVDFRVTTMNIDGNVVKLAIWDTAGQERFRTLTPSYYRGGQGIVCGRRFAYIEWLNKELSVYDVTNRTTFDRLEHWILEVETYCTKSDAMKILVGNKIDAPNREVTFEEGMQFARRHKMLFIEASAKTREGVQVAFEELIEKIIQTPGLWESNSGGVQLRNYDEEENGGWCGC
ncbi:Ras domain containing protein [Aphelenchoides besseyi]|nr:Ras domain containing protein [Aphelenchoides besseyi]KAI6208434.1 Ras domain containing protein [Aphelenchoides besseyi]